MPRKKINEWPVITEITKPKRAGKKGDKSRVFTIQDARNTWEVVAIQAEEIRFEINGFSKFYFKFDGELLRCFKKLVIRPSDSGEVACFDDRYNLMDDNGDRRTLRLKNLKQYVVRIFKS